MTDFAIGSEKIEESIVFCDFDGTITRNETFVSVLEAFSPQLANEIIPQIYERKISLKEGVRRILEAIPSSRVGEIAEFVRGSEIRKGFSELLDFLSSNDVKMVIVSGGLKIIIREVLGEELLRRVEALYALDLDTGGEYVRVISEHEDAEELLSKPMVVGLYQSKEIIAIGDSITDLNLSRMSDIVFARDRLANYLKSEGRHYIEWKNFIDVKNHLKTHWGLFRS